MDKATAHSLRKELKSALRIKWGDMSRDTVDLAGRRASVIAKLVRQCPNDRRTPKYAQERWQLMMHYPMAFAPWDGPLGSEFERLMTMSPDAGEGRAFHNQLGAAAAATEGLVLAETEEAIERAPGSSLAAQAYMARAICQVAPCARGDLGEPKEACDAVVDLMGHLGERRVGHGLRGWVRHWIQFQDRAVAASLALTLADSAFKREDSPERLSFLYALSEVAQNRQLRSGLAARMRRLDALDKPFELRLRDVVEGGIVDLAHLRGNVVIVDFWAMWCPSCKEIVPRLAELYESHRHRGLAIVSVSCDDDGLPVVGKYAAKRRLREYFKDHPASWFQCLSTRYHRRWGVDRIPTAFVVDRQGRLRNSNAFAGNSVADIMERFGILVMKLLDEPRNRGV